MKYIIENDKIIVFLNKEKIKENDFNNEEDMEFCLRNIFSDLNDKYDIELNGYYNIDVYKDENYGIILEIQNEDLDYYNYFDQIDMKINISKKNIFLYEVKYEFIDNSLFKEFDFYKYFDKFYIRLINVIDRFKFYRLLEFSNIIYGDKIDEILKYSKKVNI